MFGKNSKAEKITKAKRNANKRLKPIKPEKANKNSCKVVGYYNISTNEFEYVSILGTICNHLMNYSMETDLKAYVHQIDVQEYNQVIETLSEYVKNKVTQ